MVQKETKIVIVCNSGVLEGKIIGVSRGTSAVVGSIVTISAIRVVPNNAAGILKGSIFKAVIIRTRSISKYNGFMVQSSVNAAVLIKNNGEMMGTSAKGHTSPFFKDHPLASGVAKNL